MASYPDELEAGAFVPTTDIWDPTNILDMSPQSDEFKECLVALRNNINEIALVLIIKDSGYYAENEFVNGQSFLPDPSLTSASSQTPVYRQVFRMTVNFGALPNTAAKTSAHGLTVDSSFTFTRMYGCATDTTANAYIPIPYASPTAANNIELSADGTNVTITTGSNRSAFDTTYVVLEYLKQ